jgi:CBS domain-containing protein
MAQPNTQLKARDIMTPNSAFVSADTSVQEAAAVLAREDIGVLLVCEANGRLRGMVTDRDIVVKVVATGRSPVEVAVGDLADQPEVVTIGADDAVDEAIETMKRHKVRRLPVIDGHTVVGMLSQGDIARSQPDGAVASLVEVLST